MLVIHSMEPLNSGGFELNEVHVTSMSIIPTCDQVPNLEHDDDEYEQIVKRFDEFLESFFNCK